MERTSPVATTRTLYSVLNAAASCKWRLVIADVSTAFLNSPTEDKSEMDKTYVQFSKDRPCYPNQVAELTRASYGTVEGARKWY